ncbi:MAG: hypothetical protein K2P69_04975, partial [Eubacterium sp.]|nr:hypothetical protein [Eubacterium sp.]
AADIDKYGQTGNPCPACLRAGQRLGMYLKSYAGRQRGRSSGVRKLTIYNGCGEFKKSSQQIQWNHTCCNEMFFCKVRSIRKVIAVLWSQ